MCECVGVPAYGNIWVCGLAECGRRSVILGRHIRWLRVLSQILEQVILKTREVPVCVRARVYFCVNACMCMRECELGRAAFLQYTRYFLNLSEGNITWGEENNRIVDVKDAIMDTVLYLPL